MLRANELTRWSVLNSLQGLKIEVFGVDKLSEGLVGTTVLVVDLKARYVPERVSCDAEERVVFGVHLLQVPLAKPKSYLRGGRDFNSASIGKVVRCLKCESQGGPGDKF